MALYRGAGGATFDVTPPPEGSNLRELFDAQVASGDLVAVDEPKKAPARKVTAPVAENGED